MKGIFEYVKELFSIGEAAEFAGITRRIILNYEDRGLIVPDVKDGSSGNRYYTIDTLTKIRTIRSYQRLGLTLDEIREYFIDSTDLMSIIKRLEALRDEINFNIEKLYEQIHKEHEPIHDMIFDTQTIYRRIFHAETTAEKTKLLRDTALEALRTYDTVTKKPIYFTEFSLDFPNEVSFCVVVPPESKGENIVKLSPVRALCLYHHGAYEELPAVHNQLLTYAKENNFSPAGIFRHIYLEGPPQHKNKDKYITQVLLLIEE